MSELPYNPKNLDSSDHECLTALKVQNLLTRYETHVALRKEAALAGDGPIKGRRNLYVAKSVAMAQNPAMR